MTISLPTPEHFNFKECLHFLNRSDLERLHFVEDERVRKAVTLAGKQILLEVWQYDDSALKISCLNNATVDERAVISFTKEWFDFKRNLGTFYKFAKQDALLTKLISNFAGLRLVRIHDIFQAVCWAILGQQVNIKFAYTIYARLIETYGTALEFENRKYWFFPEPERIAKLEVDELKALQLTGNKSKFLIGVAQAIENNELQKDALIACGDIDFARSELIKLKGVGPWTANYVLMRCLGYQDAFPLEDVGLHHAIKNALDLPEKPKIEKVAELAERWAGWRAYAAFYLYRSLL